MLMRAVSVFSESRIQPPKALNWIAKGAGMPWIGSSPACSIFIFDGLVASITRSTGADIHNMRIGGEVDTNA
jgi:hypothetical protein